MQDFPPGLVAVLLEEAGVEGDAAVDVEFCAGAVEVTDLGRRVVRLNTIYLVISKFCDIRGLDVLALLGGASLQGRGLLGLASYGVP